MRNEIARLRRQIRAQSATSGCCSAPTASAELLLTRMRAKINNICDERDGLRNTSASQSTRS